MWEYTTVYIQRQSNVNGKIDPKFEDWMNEMGQEGWELVSVSPRMGAGTHVGDTLYFKRQKATVPTAS